MRSKNHLSSVLSRNHGVNIVFEGDRAKTDGKTITLPATPLDADLSSAQVRALDGYIDTNSGRIRHSEHGRVLSFHDKCDHNGKEDLAALHTSLEETWVNHKVIDEYAGSAKNIGQLQELIANVSELPEFNIKNAEDVGFRLKCMSHSDITGDSVQEVIDGIPEEYRPIMDKFSSELSKVSNSEEAIKLAKAIHKHLNENSEEEMQGEEGADSFDPSDGADDPEGENSPGFDQGKADRGEPQQQGQGDGADDGKGEGVKSSEEAIHSEDPADDSASGCIGGHGDYLGGKYKIQSTANDVVYRRSGAEGKHPHDRYQRCVESTDLSNYNKIMNNIGTTIRIMSSKLKRALAAAQQRDWDRYRERGKLDTKRLVSAFQLKEDVYKVRTDREEHDTAVTLLVDLSGSMGGRKAQVAGECVTAISECLGNAPGITFSVVGFHNSGPATDSGRGGGRYHRVERLDTIMFKEFETPFRTSRPAISQIENAVGGNNTDYDFIVNAINDLKARPEKRKVLITFSDGSPASAGQGTYDEIIGLCKGAVLEGERQGVECVGIGIMDDSVNDIYPKSVVVKDVKELSGTAFQLLTRLLTKEVKGRGAK